MRAVRYEKLDLNLLVALNVLIEVRSVSEAARRLYLSQPAVSGALNRLRIYFGDDLLVPSGRQMILTAKAKELAGPVREALLLIKAKITTPATFDPSTAERNFVIAASDYAYNVLLADVIVATSHQAPGITFDVVSTDVIAMERLGRGEVDALITIANYSPPRHPSLELFQDEHAVVCWSGSPLAAGIDAATFLEVGHAIAFFGSDRQPSFTEIYFSKQNIERTIEVSVPTHAALPQTIVGTNRVATMYRRHAEHFARSFPITIHPSPMPMPIITETVMWHETSNNDPGLRWLIQLIKTTADRICPIGTKPIIDDRDVDSYNYTL